MSAGDRQPADDLPLFDLPLYEDTDGRVRATPAGSTSPGRSIDPSSSPGPEAASPLSALGTLPRHLGAGLADLALHGAVFGTLALLVRSVLGSAPSSGSLPAFGVLGLVFTFLYWTVSLAFWGQTPGMRWAGQRAQSITGEPLTYGQTALRWLGALATVGFVGLPLLLVSIDGRSLSDRLSDSKTLDEMR